MKSLLLILSVALAVFFTGCNSSNQSRLSSPSSYEYKQSNPSFDESKKDFILALKKEMQQENSYDFSKQEKEDRLFIYKQLMKQNF